MFVCMHTCVCAALKLTWDVFLFCSSLYFLRVSLSLKLELTDWLGWLAPELQN